MLITWDESKRLTNLKVRTLDFRMLDVEFFERALILPAKRDRWMALGRIDGRPYAAVFAVLGTEAVSVISLRIASRKERRLI